MFGRKNTEVKDLSEEKTRITKMVLSEKEQARESQGTKEYLRMRNEY